jgi:hypothetical protein
MSLLNQKKLLAGAAMATVLLLATVIKVLGGGESAMERGAGLSESQVPSQIILWIAENRKVPGYDAFSLGDAVYMVVRLGQRPTGGYAVYLGEAELDGRTLYVKVEVVEPRPWDMVSQALTYPTAVAGMRIDGHLPEAVVFLDLHGGVLARIPVQALESTE